ncbi:hypothetical protein B0H19DRAFT_1159115, partial [Mycena capillaripes]
MRPRESSPLKKLQPEPNAAVVTIKFNRPTEKARAAQPPAANNDNIMQKRSQSVGSRIPRAPSRLATTESLPPPPTAEAYSPDAGLKAKAATGIPSKAPSTPVTIVNDATTTTPPKPITPPKGSRRFRWRVTENAGKLQGAVDGLKQQNRGRKAPAAVLAVEPKGGENKRS